MTITHCKVRKQKQIDEMQVNSVINMKLVKSELLMKMFSESACVSCICICFLEATIVSTQEH